MRNKTVLFSTIGIAAIAALLSTSVAMAAVATGGVNVRSGPGASYRVISTLARGDDVDVNDQSGSWCQISQDGPDGWVACAYLADDESGYDSEPTQQPDITLGFGFGGFGYSGDRYGRDHHWDNRGMDRFHQGGMWSHRNN